MNTSFLTKTSLVTAGLTLASLAVGVSPSIAQWNYAIDSFTDGHDASGVVGSNSPFEFYGMALMEDGDNIYIGINSNLSLDGHNFSAASGGVISYGDLFFNFTGDGLDDANGNLFAINFANNTDSGVQEAGVYQNVTGTNVAQQNSGFQHLNHHANTVNNLSVNKTGGGEGARIGDLASNDAYWQSGVNQNYKVINSIASGERIGGINMLEATALASLGLNFNQFGATGTHTFGFSFDRSLLPSGDFIAHIFAECVNDGMAMVGNLADASVVEPQPVPEPASVLGLLAVGGLMLKGKRERSAS
ncbi:PEP-CTERM sorting domain-containing protein [Sodalinema gerasimenkoae]|uniref:PEP-CTERM sorting domain-containing protein n=1 Tax=Sodalinema gerasimenkoae TaxID=2862348 RepID=UPI00135CE637|nr:PEP-CTERM sorting domain-containing protein [Sodalinema gerasimenkoae]